MARVAWPICLLSQSHKKDVVFVCHLRIQRLYDEGVCTTVRLLHQHGPHKLLRRRHRTMVSNPGSITQIHSRCYLRCIVAQFYYTHIDIILETNKLGQSTERSGGWLDTYSDNNSKPAGEPEPCAWVHWVKGDCCLSKGIGLPQFLDAAPADRESALGWGLFSGFSSNRNTQVLGSCRLTVPHGRVRIFLTPLSGGVR